MVKLPIRATESKIILLFVVFGAGVGLWSAGDEKFLSPNWITKFFAAQTGISVLSSLIFRITSAEGRLRSTESAKKIEDLATEIAEIIPRKFNEAANHLEGRFKKIEHEANVRYNRQMMSQEKENVEFWHYQQDFGRERSMNILVEYKGRTGKQLLDDYELRILGTFENPDDVFGHTFHIVEVLGAHPRGPHSTFFQRGEQLACFFSEKPKISRVCDIFDESALPFIICGRIGTVSYEGVVRAQDASVNPRLIDEI